MRHLQLIFAFIRSQSGQSLLEVIVALIIGVTVASAFISLGVVSVRNSRFATDQVSATKYAQEGIEKMINIRDQSSSTNTVWTDLFNGSMPSCSQPTNPLVACANDYQLSGSSMIQSSSPEVLTPYVGNSNVPFNRKVRIADAGTNVKNVTVFVWWTDANGLHQSVLSRNIERDKLR